MVLWVAAATRAARDRDRAALKAIRERFAAQPNRRRPPMLLVLTHIDALRPFQDWAPPYDLEAGTREKARSIRAAAEAAGEELGFARERGGARAHRQRCRGLQHRRAVGQDRGAGARGASARGFCAC